MSDTLWIERLDTHAEPLQQARPGMHGIYFHNEQVAHEFVALLYSRRMWQLEHNAEKKRVDSPE